MFVVGVAREAEPYLPSMIEGMRGNRRAMLFAGIAIYPVHMQGKLALYIFCYGVLRKECLFPKIWHNIR